MVLILLEILFPNIGQIIFALITAIVGTFLTYIFVIPVLQNKINSLEEEKKSQKLNFSKIDDNISDIKTRIAILETSDSKINKLIDELFDTEKENNEKFQIMIQKNTEAITKLEATLQNLNEHTKKLDDFFTKFLEKK
jgi:N-methylhydantoinase B/oxoprolinase/acetone carboxylase alpha subunit